MSDFASPLTWYSIGVDGERKVSMVAMVQPVKSMHGECGYGPVSEIHARRDAMSGVLFVLTWGRFQSKGEDVDLLPDGMMDPFRCYGSVWQDPWTG